VAGNTKNQMTKLNKLELVEKIRHSDGFTLSEKSELIELINHNKRYGLVWEEKNENAELELLDRIPVLSEDIGKAIINSSNKDVPNHVLIEGDNLHALTSLCFTHENKIDFIYIDPPYNTGNKDFKYNDSFVDKEDSYRHSKWLSFISKRLRLAKRLLKDTGIIFISIDDNEIAQLKLLCDEIFLQENFVAKLPTIMNLKGNQDQFGFAGTHEYSIVYAKNLTKAKFHEFNVDDESMESWEQDEIGYYKKGATLIATGEDAPREKRPRMFYPILINNKTCLIEVISDEEHANLYDEKKKIFNDDYLLELKNKYEKKDYTVLLPTNDIKGYSRWRWGWNIENKARFQTDVIILKTKNGFSLYKKQRPELNELPSKKPKSIFYKPEYSSGNGTSQVKQILSDKKFNNPKPLDLIKDFIQIGSNKTSLILDFFAGSGTTLHATMQLNAQDGGTRQCVMITNNENNICEEVTYERNKRVINGYKKPNGESVTGLTQNNLRYFKTTFVGRERTLKNKRQLTQLSTDVLRIKENCYTEIKGAKNIRIFNEANLYLIIVFEDISIPKAVEIIQDVSRENTIKVYVFSEEKDPYTEDFYEVLNRIELCALPDAIYKAYQHILPKKKREVNQELNAPENSQNNI